MPDNFTQQQIDDLAHEARLLAPEGRLADLDADIKAKANMPLNVQGRFLTRIIDAFEAKDLAKYLPAPAANNGNCNGRRPDKSNPWSAEGWNVTEQGRIAKTLGTDKAISMAKSAGCKLGDTKPSPHYS
jgi:hypothetical protein